MAVLAARRYVEDLDSARDVAQNVFIKLYQKKESLEITTSFKSYLLSAVKNASLNYLRSRDVRSKHQELAAHRIPKFYEEDGMAYNEVLNVIKFELEKIPPRCRQIFELNRFQGMKNREIAEALNISIRTVETQISQALKHLRASLPRDYFISVIVSLITTCILFDLCHIGEEMYAGLIEDAWRYAQNHCIK